MFDYLIKKVFSIDIWPFNGGRNSVLAIDISHSTITLVEMSMGPEGYVLESYEIEFLQCLSQDSLSFMATKGMDSGIGRETEREEEVFQALFPDSLILALKSLIERSQCSLASRRSVVIGLSGPAVISRWLKLDEQAIGDSGFKLGLEDMEDQVELIYEHIIPFPIEESYYDYQFGHDKSFGIEGSVHSQSIYKKQSDRKSRDLKEIFIAASPRNKIEPWIEMMNELNLKLEMITLSSLSVHAALNFICEDLIEDYPSDNSRQKMVALELQKNQSILYLFQGDRLLLSRDFAFELREEEILISALCDQIKIALSQCSIGQKNEDGAHWILFGDNVLVQSLKEKIEQKLQISLTIANPFANVCPKPFKTIKFSEKIPAEEREIIQDKGSMLILAFGLALSGLINRKSDKRTRKINLLPWRASEKKAKNQAFYCALGFAVCLALFSVLGVWMYCYDQKIKTDQLASQLLSEKNQLQDQMQAIEILKKGQYQVAKNIKIIEALEQDRLRWVQFFNVLPTLLPEGLFLTSLIGKGDALTLEGNARTHSAVAALLKTLSELKEPCLFKDIQLTEITTDKQELGLKFKLQFKISS